MSKYPSLVLLLLLISSCKKTPAPIEETVEQPNSFSIQAYPKLIELEEDVLKDLGSWSEFKAMESSFEVLTRALNTEDLKLAIDDLIHKEQALAASTFPERFDQFQIKSRQQLFRTFLFKVQANLMDARDINEGMRELINAYNAYKNQFNVISGNTLDAKLLLDEE